MNSQINGATQLGREIKPETINDQSWQNSDNEFEEN